LQTTQHRALSQDIQLKREVTQLTQKEQHALQRVQETQLELDNKQGELQLLRVRELGTLEQARTAQNSADQAQADLRSALDTADQQQQQIQPIGQAADQQTALANTARDDAAQRILDAQAIRNQAAVHETAAQALRNQATIDQQAADQATLAGQQLAVQAVIDQTAADQAAQANVLVQNNIQQNIGQAVQLQTQQLQEQLAYAQVGEDMAMATT